MSSLRRAGGKAWSATMRSLLAIVLVAAPLRSFADGPGREQGARIAELATHVAPQADLKERMSATLALARINDARAVKPLLVALADENPKIRAIAATALGKLGQLSALTALRDRAANDDDDVVRAQAQAAVDKLVEATQAASVSTATTRTASSERAARPELYVVIKSWRDDSPGKLDKASRKAHAEILRDTMVSSLQATPAVTSSQADAQRYRLDPRQLDLSVVKMDVHPAGPMMEVEAELRLAISDGNGRMMAFISGGAKVQVPRATYKKSGLPEMRRQAVETAVHGLFGKLIDHLRRTRS